MHSIGDAAELLFGKGSRELVGSIHYIYLASPTLGSAGPLTKKVSYGIALPGLLVTAVLFNHTAAKYWFVRILRGTEHLQCSTAKHWTAWIGPMLVTALLGFTTIVGVVPLFGDFLSLVGVLVNLVFTNVLPGFMLMFYIARQPPKVVEGAQPMAEEGLSTGRHWLIDSLTAYKRGWKDALLLILTLSMILSGAFIINGGTYSTVLSINRSYDEGLISVCLFMR